MKLKEKKINLLKKNYEYSEKLLNLCNLIELNLNYENDFEYLNFNLINIHTINENTFNYSMINNYYNLIDNFNEYDNKNFNKVYSFVYKQFNFYIDFLENIIKMYSKYIINDISLKNEIEKLQLNTNIDNKFISEFFLNFQYITLNY